MLEIFDLKKSEFISDSSDLCDPFLLMQYDEKNGRLMLASQFFGTAYPIYLMEDNGKLYFSDSLISIRKISNKRFYLNTDMLPYFFYNGFLPGKHTLIQGVYKLPPRKSLVVENGKCLIGNQIFSFSSVLSERDSLEKKYYNAMVDALTRSLGKRDSINLALSGGFDSNMLLYLVKSLFPKTKVDCFSVGGTIGTNEISTAYSIAQKYDNVNFTSALVSSSILDSFDDIVFRLQGCTYERGIFLQYELAKMLHNHKCTHLICGECADQVFHSDSYKDLDEGRFLYGYKESPFEMASYVVLKKSAVMLKSFGITGIYPYLDTGVVEIGAMTRLENGDNKAFHRQQCKKYIPKDIFNKLCKVGGTTQLLPLMDEGKDYEMLCKKSKYYDSTFRFTGKYPRQESIMDYYLSLQFIESFERQFCDERT